MNATHNALILIAIVGFTLLASLGIAHVMQGGNIPNQAPSESDSTTIEKLPEFSFVGMNGKDYASSDFKGKVILINFWASWCLPCVEEFPKLIDLAATFPDDVVLIAVSSDIQQNRITKFINDLKSKSGYDLNQDNIIVTWDKDKSITFHTFHTLNLPETILVSPDGKMVQKIVGANWDFETVENDVKNLIR